MSNAVEFYNTDYVLGERLEIPNSDLCAVRRESYTEVLDTNGDQVVILPPRWSLFDIEIWCSGYAVGRNQGEKHGEKKGRENVRQEIMRTLGFSLHIVRNNEKAKVAEAYGAPREAEQ